MKKHCAGLLRRALLGAGCAALASPVRAFAQTPPEPRLHRVIGDTGWSLHADSARVELRAAPSLCRNLRVAENGVALPQGAPGYSLGETGLDFAVRFALVFDNGTPGLPNDMAAFAGISFTTPTDLGDLGFVPGGERVAMFSLQVAGQEYGMIAFRNRASIDGWLVLMLSDVREALSAMEYEGACQVAFAILTRGAPEFALMFELDTSSLAAAKRALYAEFNRRSDLLAAGTSFERGNMR